MLHEGCTGLCQPYSSARSNEQPLPQLALKRADLVAERRLLVARQLPHGDWWAKSIVLGGLNIGAFFPLLFIAAERLPGGVAAAVAGVQPVIVLALGLVVLRARISPASAVAALVGAGGVALIVLGPTAQLDPWGIVAGIGGVAATGLGIVLTKRWGRPPGVGAVAYAGWQLTAGGTLLLPLTLFTEGVPAVIELPAVVAYTWLATVGGLLAYTLWFRGIQRLPVIAPGLLALLSPVVAAIIGVGVLGETFTELQACGIALVLLALVGGQLTGRSPGGLSPCRTASGSQRARPRSEPSRHHRPGRTPSRSAR